MWWDDEIAAGEEVKMLQKKWENLLLHIFPSCHSAVKVVRCLSYSACIHKSEQKKMTHHQLSVLERRKIAERLLTLTKCESSLLLNILYYTHTQRCLISLKISSSSSSSSWRCLWNFNMRQAHFNDSIPVNITIVVDEFHQFFAHEWKLRCWVKENFLIDFSFSLHLVRKLLLLRYFVYSQSRPRKHHKDDERKIKFPQVTLDINFPLSVRMKRTLNWSNPQALPKLGPKFFCRISTSPSKGSERKQATLSPREETLIVRLCMLRAALKSRVKARENVEVEVKCSGLTHERVYKFLSTIIRYRGRTWRFMLIESGLQWKSLRQSCILLSMHFAYLLSRMWWFWMRKIWKISFQIFKWKACK